MSQQPFSRRVFMAAAGLSAEVAAADAQDSSERSPVVQQSYPQSNLAFPTKPIRIVTDRDIDPSQVEILQAAAPHVEVLVCRTEEEYLDRVRDAEVIIGEPRQEVLRRAPKLKWVQVSGAGMEWMDQALRDSPVVVTNCARIFAPGITETGIGLLLCLTRGISTYYMPQFYKHQLRPVGTPRSADHIELAGKTMAIVGMGGIGSAMARRAHYGFDMRIIATDAKPLPKPEYVAELHTPAWFPEMIRQADVVVSAAPLTPLTNRMFNEAAFRSMKPEAFYIALSRGKLFDDMALVKALREKWIRGAGLDVFPVEPPPPDHPIYDLPNVVMTPHTSGWSPDREHRLIELYAENIRRYSNGEPLLNVVDKQRGY